MGLFSSTLRVAGANSGAALLCSEMPHTDSGLPSSPSSSPSTRRVAVAAEVPTPVALTSRTKISWRFTSIGSVPPTAVSLAASETSNWPFCTDTPTKLVSACTRCRPLMAWSMPTPASAPDTRTLVDPAVTSPSDVGVKRTIFFALPSCVSRNSPAFSVTPPTTVVDSTSVTPRMSPRPTSDPSIRRKKLPAL